MINRDGAAGTLAQLRQTNPAAAMTGPAGGAPEGTVPGLAATVADHAGRLADHEHRLSALEAAESSGPADGESESGE